MSDGNFELSRKHLIEAATLNLNSNTPESQLKGVRILLNLQDSQANFQVIRHLHKLKGRARKEAFELLSLYYDEHYDELVDLLNNPSGRVRENAVLILELIPIPKIFMSLIYLVDDARVKVHTNALRIMREKINSTDWSKYSKEEVLGNYVRPLLNSLQNMNPDVYPQRIHLLEVLFLFCQKRTDLEDLILTEIAQLYSRVSGKFARLLNLELARQPFSERLKLLEQLVTQRSPNIDKYILTLKEEMQDLSKLFDVLNVLLKRDLPIQTLLKNSEAVTNFMDYVNMDEEYSPQDREKIAHLMIMAYEKNVLDLNDPQKKEVFIFYLLRKLHSPQHTIRKMIIDFILKNKELLSELLDNAAYKAELKKVLPNLLKDPVADIRHATVSILERLSPEESMPIMLRALDIDDPRIREFVVNYIKQRIIEKRKHFADLARDELSELGYKVLARYDPSIVEDLYEKIKSMKPDELKEALKIAEYIDDFDKVKPLLEKLMRHPNKYIRAFTVTIIGMLRSREAFNVLVEGLRDPDKRVVANIIEAFEQIMSPRDLSIIVPFINDENNRVRANTAHLLYKLGYKELALKVLARMLDSGDNRMILSALWVIKDLKLSEFEEKAKLYLSSTDNKIRKLAMEAIRAIKEGMQG